MKSLITSVGVCLVMATAAWSGAPQKIALSDTVYSLPEILVEAERVPEVERIANRPAFVAIVPLDDASRRVSSAADYLAQTVGCHIRSTGGHGAYSTASIRGSSAKQVRVYIDGVPLSQAQSGIVDLADLPLASLMRIEVYRGFGPYDLSGSSIGGVINVVTAEADDRNRGHLSLSMGSFSTRRLSGSYALGTGDWDFMVIGGLLSSNGDYEFLDTNGSPYSQSDGKAGKRVNNGLSEYEALLKLTGPLAGGTVVASDQFYYRQQGLPGYSTIQSETERMTKTYNLLHLGWKKTCGWRLPWEIDLGLHGLCQIDHFEDQRPKKAGVKPDEENRTTSLGGKLGWKLHLLPYRQTLRGLISLSREEFRPEEHFIETVTGEEQTRETFAISLEDEIHLVGDRVRLVPGGRYETYTDATTPFRSVRADMAAYFRGMTETETSYSLLTGSIGVVASPAYGIRIKANYGRHHRAPTLMELFGYRGWVLPNPGLEPEVGLNRDIGIGWQGSPHPDLPLSVEYVYFWSDVDRLIMFVYVPFAQASQAINIDSADLEGHEVSISLGPWHAFTLTGNVTHLTAVNTGPVTYLNGKNLPNRPEIEAFVRAGWSHRGLSAFYEFNYIGGNYWNAYNTKAPNNEGPLFDIRRLHNIGITAPTGVPGTDFTVEVRNIADERFEDLMGYPLPGRSVYATARLGI